MKDVDISTDEGRKTTKRLTTAALRVLLEDPKENSKDQNRSSTYNKVSEGFSNLNTKDYKLFSELIKNALKSSKFENANEILGEYISEEGLQKLVKDLQTPPKIIFK